MLINEVHHSPGTEQNAEVARARIKQIFEYLKALHEHRNPVVRQVDEYAWTLRLRDLPTHHCIIRGWLEEIAAAESGGETAEASSADEAILRVRRPQLTAAPEPPASIGGWVAGEWKNPSARLTIRPLPPIQPAPEGETAEEAERRNAIRQEREQEHRSRELDFHRWVEDVWQPWTRTERPARATMKVFETLYDLYARLQREGERLEVVLGDGLLVWRVSSGGLRHPVLLQRLQLAFDPDVPEFTLADADHPVELYAGIGPAVPSLDSGILADCREDLDRAPIHPLSGAPADEYLRRVANRFSPSGGEFIGDAPIVDESDDPRIGRDPVIFLRERALGFGLAIERVLEDLSRSEELPHPLLGAVGIDVPHPARDGEHGSARAAWEEPETVLLSKPANPEQIRIAERLDTRWSVLVQGPPGTGKTHTIANLLGHLLAQGKSVLVTSHTSKALRVLRHQVVEALQPLCVSVLDSDAESRQELEDSVRAIVERLGSSDAADLDAEAEQLAAERTQVLTELRQTRQALLDARSDEYRPVIVDGDSLPPADAARRVQKESAEQGWIPGPIALGSPLPLSAEEVLELYRTSGTVTAADEAELGFDLPAPDQLPSSTRFSNAVAELADLEDRDLDLRADLWSVDASNDLADLENLAEALRQATSGLEDVQVWQLEAISAGASTHGERGLWDEFIAEIEAVRREAVAAHALIVRHGPELAPGELLEEQAKILGEILSHLRDGGGLGGISLLFRPSWKRLIDACSVSDRKPSTPEHFEALQASASLAQARERLARRWERQMTPLGAPPADSLGLEPERTAERFVVLLRRALGWFATEWQPVESALGEAGLHWADLLAEQTPRLDRHGDLLCLRDTAQQHLPGILDSRLRRLRRDELQQELSNAEAVLSRFGSADVISQLTEGVRRRDADAYASAYARLIDLHQRSTDLRRRRVLLSALAGAAPAWARAIEQRQELHGESMPPGDPRRAWVWRQLYDELERRSQVSLEVLQETITGLSARLRRLTAELIDRRAWASQVRRTTLGQQQALMGYRGIVRRIGKGTGVRAPKLRAEAQRLMAECRSAVPVWIMPLSRVADTFDPRTTRFDVVVIDEASQCDMMGLLAVYLGAKVVVVGDDEQVSPDAVGQRLDEVERLIALHLKGIPNSLLYDGQRSIYDLANESFGSPIRLVEHFRCVPDIIQFSNHLSYSGTIKPLRDASRVRRSPHTATYHVRDGRYDDRAKTNRAEAETIASLVAAAITEPEYAEATFGVISLLGDNQALLIEQILRTRLTPQQFARHRILCGNASQFQGDERDVMLLSMVHGPGDGGPLRLVNAGPLDATKKRFNVAASRARDQMWVVHSMDPSTDLKPADLRLRLIRHAQDPQAVERKIERAAAAAESPFEAEVQRRLISAGFAVVPQWKVGAYRIDMVVQGNGRRLAVECDGDRFHPQEALAGDMQRQAILERLGWTFVRIRGSQFFRDPDAAMQPVFERLRSIGITPALDAEVEPEDTDDLKDRIQRRAAALREAWLRGLEGEGPAAPDAAEGTTAPQTVQADGPSQAPSTVVSPASATAVSRAPEEGDKDPREDVPRSTAEPGRPTIPGIVMAGARPYERAACPFGAPDPARFSSDMDVLRSVYYVVEKEAPIHLDLALRRTAEFFGYQRLGSQVRTRLEAAVDRLVRAGRVAHRGDFLWLVGSASNSTAVRTPGVDGYVRPVEEIALEEIAAAVRLVRTESEEGDVLTRASRLLGFSRSGGKIQDRLAEASQMAAVEDL